MYPRDKETYATYKASIREFRERERIVVITTDEEQYVSSRGCDCCGSPKQQLLVEAKAIVKFLDDKGEFQHVTFEVCEDCQYYLEYGSLDDTQMDEIENS